MERFTLKLVGFKIFSEEFFEIPIEKMKEKNTSGPKTAEKKWPIIIALNRLAENRSDS